jgi:hypothetical protein
VYKLIPVTKRRDGLWPLVSGASSLNSNGAVYFRMFEDVTGPVFLMCGLGSDGEYYAIDWQSGRA